MTIERIGKAVGIVPGQETDGYRICVGDEIETQDEELILDAVNVICANTKTRLRHAFMEKRRPIRIEIKWGTQPQ